MSCGLRHNLPGVHCKVERYRIHSSIMQLVAGLAAVVISCHLCFSQAEVQVRVLDFRTARPVQHHTVGLLLPDSAGEIRTDSVTLFAKTDRQGIAVFLLTKPLPPSLWVLPEHSLADWSCTQTQQFSTPEVLQRGLVGAFENHPFCKNHTTISPVMHPGEVLVYLRRLSGWAAFRRFLHEMFNG